MSLEKSIKEFLASQSSGADVTIWAWDSKGMLEVIVTDDDGFKGSAHGYSLMSTFNKALEDLKKKEGS